MRRRWFLVGFLIGLALAPSSGREAWRRLRDSMARAIDALLRLGAR